VSTGVGIETWSGESRLSGPSSWHRSVVAHHHRCVLLRAAISNDSTGQSEARGRSCDRRYEEIGWWEGEERTV
jgi:hypothetical protein